ncbi:MAG: HAD family hydrolase [Candidatus Aenigmarchaeota archaeon]|nr:HAD family hydrolase [Candidatus Aenigmarchaeota archaeon]
MFKAFIFDLDGTLTNSINIWASLFKKTFKKYRMEVNERDIKNQFGKPYTEIIEYFTPENKEEIIKYFKMEKDKIGIEKFKLFPFVEKTFRQLKQKNMKIAIATGNNNYLVDKIIEKYDLSEYIDYHICSEEVKKTKPDPEMIFKILKHLKIEKNETIFIGDSPYDIQMAKNAKINSCAVLTGVLNKKSAEKIKPNYIFKNIEGILKLT